MSEHRYHVDGYSSAPPEVVFAVLVDGPGWADVGARGEGGDLRVRRGAGASRCRCHPTVRRRARAGVSGAGRRLRAARRSSPTSRSRVHCPGSGYRAEVRLTPGPGGRRHDRIDWTGSFQQPRARPRHVHPPHGGGLRHGAGGRVRASRGRGHRPRGREPSAGQRQPIAVAMRARGPVEGGAVDPGHRHPAGDDDPTVDEHGAHVGRGGRGHHRLDPRGRRRRPVGSGRCRAPSGRPVGRAGARRPRRRGRRRRRPRSSASGTASWRRADRRPRRRRAGGGPGLGEEVS